MDCPVSHRISVLRGTQDTPSYGCVYGTLTLFGVVSQPLPLHLADIWGPTTPVYTYTGLAYSAFARHYSQNSLFSSGYLDVSVHPVPSLTRDPVLLGRVSPFGHLRLLAAAHA